MRRFFVLSSILVLLLVPTTAFHVKPLRFRSSFPTSSNLHRRNDIVAHQIIVLNTIMSKNNSEEPNAVYEKESNNRDRTNSNQNYRDKTTKETFNNGPLCLQTRKKLFVNGLLAMTAATAATTTTTTRNPKSYAFAETTDAVSSTRTRLALGSKSTAQEVLATLQQAHDENLLAPYVRSNYTGIAIVTGGNTGIGLETVATLCQAGMKVIVCSRNVDSKVYDSIEQYLVDKKVPQQQQQQVILQQLDLADMASIEKASTNIIQTIGATNNNKFDLLINNAGISDRVKNEQYKTAQGLELQFGTNHIGHFMFTRLLLPYMNTNGRVITVSSRAHNFGVPTTDWGNGEYPSPYSQSKLCNILFAKALQDKLIEQDENDTKNKKNIISISLHPGSIRTKIWKNTPLIWQIGEKLLIDKTVEQGASTTIYCSLINSNRLVEGGYYSDCHLETPSIAAQDNDKQLRNSLWERSEAIIQSNGYALPTNLT